MWLYRLVKYGLNKFFNPTVKKISGENNQEAGAASY
jgi:hypothetical protein